MWDGKGNKRDRASTRDSGTRHDGGEGCRNARRRGEEGRAMIAESADELGREGGERGWEEDRRDGRGGEWRGKQGRERGRRRGDGGGRVWYCVEEYHPIQAGSIDGTDVVPHDRAIRRALRAREEQAEQEAAWEQSRIIASAPEHREGRGGGKEPHEGDGRAEERGEKREEGRTGEGEEEEEDEEGEGEEEIRRRGMRTLFVGRINWRCEEKDVEEAAAVHGPVVHVKLVRNIVTGASRGYAFVEYKTEEDCRRAFELGLDLQPAPLAPCVLLDFPRQQLMKGWVPRRLGGGLGGRKESGQMRFGGPACPFRSPMRPVPRDELASLGIPVPPDCFFPHPLPPPSSPRPTPASKCSTGRNA